MKKYYLPDKDALVFCKQNASPEFWDRHWSAEDIRNSVCGCKTDSYFIPSVRKYLPPGSRILEGGCGMGQLVHALSYQGYNAVGIDNARKTVSTVHGIVPWLNIMAGDVKDLPFSDDTFDGYVSAGVIEHFWEGYRDIMEEMHRVIKHGGFLFLSFPYLSPLRSIKRFLGGYPLLQGDPSSSISEVFYQFAFRRESVRRDLENHGFICRESVPYDGIKGLKDEVEFFKPFLQSVYDGKKLAYLRPCLDGLFRLFSPHMMLLVFQKAPAVG